MKFLKRFRLYLAALLALGGAGVAFAEGQTGGGMPPAMLSRSGRQFTYVIPQLRTQTSPASTTCTITTGTVTVGLTSASGAQAITSQSSRDGSVFFLDFASVTAIDAADTYLGAIPYPTRLMIDFYDASSNGTLVCSSLTLTGYRWDGMPIKETLTSIVETTTTPRFSANAFSSLTRVVATGCSGGASGDLFRIRTSPWIALPRKIHSSADIDSVCVTSVGSGITVATAGYSFERCQKGNTFVYDFASNTIYALNNEFDKWKTGSASTSSCQQDRLMTTFRGRASPLETGF